MRRALAVRWVCALAAAGVLLGGCGREEKEAGHVYDPRYIASEADRGNLAPLKELNAACSEEVKIVGVRSAACLAQDQVRDFRKRFEIRF
jgi:hypothetical protein